MNIKRIISSITLVILVLLCSITLSFAAQPEDFPDYISSAWHADAINYAVNNSIMQGTSDGKLEPDRFITRAEFVTMVNRVFNTYNKANLEPYTDMTSTDWHYDNIAKGVQMGIIKGYNDRTMRPEEPITRAQAMVIIAHTMGLDTGSKIDLSKFIDAGQIEEWAIPYIAAMVKDGRVTGFTDDSLRPQEYITRAQTASLLLSSFPNLVKDTYISGTYEGNIVLNGDKNAVIDNAVFKGALILAPSMADGKVDIRNTSASQLIVWGNRDVYVYPGTTISEKIIISRTDGPCTVHWMGEAKTLPEVVFKGGTNDSSKVVDASGTQIISKTESEPSYSEDDSTHYPAVYFDPQNGQSVASQSILDNGLIQPIATPVKDGYIFGGWYKDKEGDNRFSFTQQATDGMYLYAKWYTPVEWEEIQKLNAIVSGATVSIFAETDFLALVDGTTMPCKITSSADNQKAIKVELVRKDTGAVLARINSLAPGETVTSMEMVSAMPPYGNYEAKIVVTPEGETGHFDIDAMIYVAYLWNRGDSK